MRHDPTTHRTTRSTRRLRAVRTGLAATIAAAGLVTLGAAPASAQAVVVPAGCGLYSGFAPPAGYTYVEMTGTLYVAPGAGPYFVVGTTSSDTITLSGANDIACGRAGADYIDGSAGEDRIHGGTDNDEIRGGTGDDPLLSGGGGRDTIWGDKGNAGGPYGDDVLLGGDADDTLNGEDGADTLNGGPHVNGDTGDGGPGVDSCSTIENPTNC